MPSQSTVRLTHKSTMRNLAVIMGMSALLVTAGCAAPQASPPPPQPVVQSAPPPMPAPPRGVRPGAPVRAGGELG
jgi:hypothetical protein